MKGSILMKCLMMISVFAAAALGVYRISQAQNQSVPVYAFAAFDKNYTTLLSSARSGGYQVKEDEINSPYGKFSIRAEKALNFYKEDLFLFFNEKKELIAFTVRFTLAENQSKTVLDRLVQSIKDKMVEKYGPGERANFPYFKVVEGKYEILIKPRQASSMFADSAFKFLSKFAEYQVYYTQEVQRLENEEISKTVKNF